MISAPNRRPRLGAVKVGSVAGAAGRCGLVTALKGIRAGMRVCRVPPPPCADSGQRHQMSLHWHSRYGVPGGPQAWTGTSLTLREGRNTAETTETRPGNPPALASPEA
ncbi:hypothetical protein Misp05_36430 [Micromonospora sp. NBRC 107095]|nr:hypothetical protein Misp05_36430 [Micromonospora sp. NBRC 107095]